MSLTEFGKHILVAVDLSDDWTNVVAHGARIAGFCGARLHVLHVVESPSASLRRHLSKKDLQVHMKRMREDALERINKRIAEVEAAGIKCQVHTAGGKPEREIVALALDLKAGLIVAGAGTTEGAEWLFVGTVADRLIRNNRIPVLMVGRECPKPLKRILVPTDLDRADLAALKLARKIARESKGRVSVLHVYARPSLLHRYSGNVAELRREAKETAVRDFDAWLKSAGIPADEKQPHKLLRASTDTVDPADAIVADASRLDMDLIVMALGGVTFLESFMIGAVSERVIRNLPCSFLALPQAWARRRAR